MFGNYDDFLKELPAAAAQHFRETRRGGDGTIYIYTIYGIWYYIYTYNDIPIYHMVYIYILL